MTPAQFRALIAEIVSTNDGAGQASRVALLIAELEARGLSKEEAQLIFQESIAAEIARVESARLAARATKLAAIRTALGLS